MPVNKDFKPFIEKRPHDQFFIPTRVRYASATNSETGMIACAVQFIDDEASAQPAPFLMGRQMLTDIVEQLQRHLKNVSAP